MEQPEPRRAATLVPDAPADGEPAPALPRPPIHSGPAPLPARRPYLPLRPHRRLGRPDRAITAALFLGSLGLYTATLTHDLSVVSGDSNELITKSALFQVAHSPGSPTYEWIGKLFTLLPFGEIATRVTWMSAVLGAVSVALVYVIAARFLGGPRLTAAGAAAIFALSLTFWSQAVIAELYVPNVGLLGGAVWCLLEWAASRSVAPGDMQLANPHHARTWMLAAAALFALANGVHLSDLMFIPVFALFMLLGWPVAVTRTDGGAGWLAWLGRGIRALDWPLAPAACGVAALGLLPYGWLALAQPNNPSWDMWPSVPPNWTTFYNFTLNAFANLRFRLPYTSWPDRTMLILHLTARNFGLPALPFLLAGIGRLLARHTRLFYLLGGMALANLVFYGLYTVPDLDVFFLPAYWALAPMLALGLAWAAEAAARAAAFVLRRGPPRGRMLAGGALTALVLAAAGLQLGDNFAINNQAADVAFRDFYGNMFAGLPQGAWFFHRGASLGYDLVYYTQLYHVRPDVHVVIGPQPGEPASPPWPDGPAYSGVLKHDGFTPAFIWDPTGANNKWYTPVLIGMFRWTGMLNGGWLRLYRLSPNEAPPPDWLVPGDAPAARATIPFDVPMTPALTLLGADLPAQAVAGRTLRLVRYWRTTDPALPSLATVLGEHRAGEVHVPLLAQLPDYLAARQIALAALPGYVVREAFAVVIPSNTPPGRYRITVATTARRLEALQIDPAPPAEVLPRELTLGWVQVSAPAPGALPDPLQLTGPGPTETLP